MTISNYLDTSPVIGDKVYLHPSCQVIGDVTIGDDSSVWCNTVLRGDVNRIVIGRGSNVQDLSMGHVWQKTPDNPEGHPRSEPAYPYFTPSNRARLLVASAVAMM